MHVPSPDKQSDLCSSLLNSTPLDLSSRRRRRLNIHSCLGT